MSEYTMELVLSPMVCSEPVLSAFHMEVVALFGMNGTAVVSVETEFLSSPFCIDMSMRELQALLKISFISSQCEKNEKINDFNKIKIIEKIPKANILPTFLLNTKSIILPDENGVLEDYGCQTLSRHHSKSAKAIGHTVGHLQK